METEIRKSEDQSLRPQESIVGSIGPGQLIVSHPGENQEGTDPSQHNEQNETVIETSSVTESTAEIGTTDDTTNNDMEDKMENKSETTNETKDTDEAMDNPEMECDPDQGSSQNNDQVAEDQPSAIVDSYLTYLEEEEVTLSLKQAKGLAALLTTKSTVEASRVSGIPERTLRRWITDPGFKLAFKEAINEIKQVYIIETLSLLEPSIQARRDLLENPTQSGAAIKEKVSDKNIKSCEKSLEMLTLEERVERLERLIRKDE